LLVRCFDIFESRLGKGNDGGLVKWVVQVSR